MSKAAKKILIVEDEEMLLDLYLTRLGLEGYEVRGAANGAEGLDVITEFKPDLVLLDILMPFVDGYEFLRRCKDNQSTKDIPVIIFSNLSQKSEIEKGLSLGAKDFIVKSSIPPLELTERVKQYFFSHP